MTRSWLRRGAGAVALLLAGAPAAAHTSYLMPSSFAPSRGEYVTLEASFTEDFFKPEIAVLSDDYHVIRPDGSRGDFDAITEFRQLVVLENALSEEGTYRFTTGTRLGRVARRALVDGEWETIEDPDAPLPEGATEVMSSQTETVADVYVTQGAPSRAAVDAVVGRLAIQPVTHPNEIYLDEGFTFDLTFDGAPLAGQELLLYRDGGAYEEPKYEEEIVTDENGRVALNFDKPGVYLVMTRHRAAPPADAAAETDERSYTTSLTFEVLR